jgi:hypothetical protein
MGAARVALRVGGILALLLAAIVLTVGTREYPGITQPALRFTIIEVLPLLEGLLSIVLVIAGVVRLTR